MAPNARPPSTPLQWAAIVGASLIALGVIFFENNLFYGEFSAMFVAPPLSLREARDPYVRITIDFGDGKKRAFRGEAPSEMTALLALRQSAVAGHLALQVDARGEITAIDGVLARDGRQWRMYRGETSVDDLPGHLIVSAGDRITFRYE